MGSAASTPSNEGSNDPWWNIENQNLDLNPVSAANTEPMENFRDPMEVDDRQQDNVEHQVQSTENETIISTVSENVPNVAETHTANDELDSETSVVASTSRSHEDEPKQSTAVNGNQRQTLEEFKEELRIKREKRKCAIAELRNEMLSLRKQLEHEKLLNKTLMSTHDTRAHSIDISENDSEHQQCEQSERNITLRTQLTEAQYELQKANAENLMLSTELAATKRKTQSLKDIIAACKEIIQVRETELTQVFQ